MILDGKNVDYKDWCALREATSAGMDTYFSELSNKAEVNISEGTPVTGYCFMYMTNKGELWSPFFNNTLQEASAYLNIPVEDNKFAMFTQQRVGSNVKVDEINVDPTGRGFYYWPDREMAEDYMKILSRQIGSTKVTSTEEFIQSPLGQYVLFRVEGIAVANTNGDAGFTMNEMKIVGEPVVIIPAMEPYDSLHNSKN